MTEETNEDFQFRENCYKYGAKKLYLSDNGIYYFYNSNDGSLGKFSRKYIDEQMDENLKNKNESKKFENTKIRNLKGKAKRRNKKRSVQNNYYNNLESSENYCKHCSSNVNLLRNLQIMSREDTLNKLISDGSCISRYGDYEFNIIFGNSVKYQTANDTLSKRLKEILVSNEKRHLVGISNYINPNNQKEIKKNNTWWKKYVEKSKLKLIKCLDFNKKYYSANISRFYIELNDKSGVPIYVNLLKSLWEGRDILIVEGKQTRLGVGNDLFDNAKSIMRILGPIKNAFNVYSKILNETLTILKNQEIQDENNIKDKLVLISMGPTATVLAYDLCKAGYQAIDIGHVDIEYEWFIRQVNYKSHVEFKYVNESSGGDININDNVQDQRYYDQIISIINEI